MLQTALTDQTAARKWLKDLADSCSSLETGVGKMAETQARSKSAGSDSAML